MFILIDKPPGITSHGVIDILRRITGIERIGHAGTLDPNATGLLIVAVGRESTKKLKYLLNETDKVYSAEIELGKTSTTDDSEGDITLSYPKIPSEKNIRAAIKSFIGEQDQVPPIYSAIKIKGKKAYEIARRGKTVAMRPRKIVIHYIKLVDYSYPDLKIEIKVSSGTYIRSTARDLGVYLKTGAYLKNLRRLSIGVYNVKDAVKIKDLTDVNWRDFAFPFKDE